MAHTWVCQDVADENPGPETSLRFGDLGPNSAPDGAHPAAVELCRPASHPPIWEEEGEEWEGTEGWRRQV